MTVSGTGRVEVDTEFVSWREMLSRPHLAPLVLVCLGVWLHAADGLLVATMMPAIVADIGGTRALPWTIALYETGSIVAGAASGLMTIRYGLKKPMAIAAILFAVGCTISAIAPQMLVLLLGRFFQGIGGGGLVAMSLVSVKVLFPSRMSGRAIASISALWGVSSFLGPFIGALFADYASWRFGFLFFTLQACLLSALILASRLPPSTGKDTVKNPRFPAVRLCWLSAAVASVAWAGIQNSALLTLFFVCAGIVMLAVFLWLDSQAGDARLLPSRPINLRNPPGAALIMLFGFAASTIALGLYGPILMIRIHDISVLQAGCLLLAESVSWSIMAIAISGVTARHDPLMIAIGMTLVFASVVCLAWAVPFGPIWLIAVGAIIQGGGFGVSWTFVLRRATALAEQDDALRVAGGMPTIQRLGYAFGAAYVGIVANASGIATMSDGSSAQGIAACVYSACLAPAAIGLIAMVWFVRARAD
jgi:MFS family permease